MLQCKNVKNQLLTYCVFVLHIQTSWRLTSSELGDLCASPHLRSSYFASSHLQPHLRIFISHLLQSSLSLHIFGSSSRSYPILVKISVCGFYNWLQLDISRSSKLHVYKRLPLALGPTVVWFEIQDMDVK